MAMVHLLDNFQVLTFREHTELYIRHTYTTQMCINIHLYIKLGNLYINLLFKGHRSTIMHVVAMVHSLDNFQVLSAEEDGSTHVWQAQDGVLLLTCDTNAALLAVTPSMKYAISGPGNTEYVI